MSKFTHIDRDKYITILGWMVTELELKGNELIVYAIIYGFTQASSQKYTGSLQYLADWTNSTKQGVIKCLKQLEAKNYITKKQFYNNNIKYCEYTANRDSSKQC